MTRHRPAPTRRGLLAGGAAAAGGLWLPRAARPQAAPRRGGTLRWAQPTNPASLDPLTGRNGSDFNALYALFDALVDFDPATLALRPGLAQSWQFTDPRTLVIDLQEDVAFHDGTPFRADSVKFNLERYQSDPRSNVKADLATLDEVEVVGLYRVALHLNRPNAALPTILTDRVGCMVSPASVEAAKDGDVDRAPVGTGPFRFVSWEDGERIRLARNGAYWQAGRPWLDAVEIAVLGDEAAALRSVAAGETDLATTLSAQLKAVADRDPGLRYHLGPTLSMTGAYLNYGRPPLDDLRVRQALNLAVDRDELNRAIALGLDEPGCTLLPREHWACDPVAADYYRHDPARARALLAEAGHPDGLDLPMVGWSDPLSVKWQEVVAAQCAAAGIRLRVTAASPQQSSAMFFGPAKIGAGRMSLIAGRPDPSQQFDALFGKDAYFNASGVELPGYRALLDASLEAADDGARKAALSRLQRFEVENAMLLVLLFNSFVTAFNPRVRDFASGLLDKPKLTGVWLEA